MIAFSSELSRFCRKPRSKTFAPAWPDMNMPMSDMMRVILLAKIASRHEDAGTYLLTF